MDVWTTKKGYPLVRLKKEDNLIVATQERFLLQVLENEIYDLEFIRPDTFINETIVNNTDENYDNDNDKWFLPLSLITNENKSAQTYWMRLNDSKLFILIFNMFTIN